jgi:hypothetical protein
MPGGESPLAQVRVLGETIPPLNIWAPSRDAGSSKPEVKVPVACSGNQEIPEANIFKIDGL